MVSTHMCVYIRASLVITISVCASRICAWGTLSHNESKHMLLMTGIARRSRSQPFVP